MCSITIARQGTKQNPILWEIVWDGPGFYAGSDGQTIKLRAETSMDAHKEAYHSGLGTATYHETEDELIAAHGNNW